MEDEWDESDSARVSMRPEGVRVRDRQTDRDRLREGVGGDAGSSSIGRLYKSGRRQAGGREGGAGRRERGSEREEVREEGMPLDPWAKRDKTSLTASEVRDRGHRKETIVPKEQRQRLESGLWSLIYVPHASQHF